MIRRIRFSISLQPNHHKVLRELAEQECSGNMSAAVARLLESHPATKSRFALST
jgi:hypothetical protein